MILNTYSRRFESGRHRFRFPVGNTVQRDEITASPAHDTTSYQSPTMMVMIGSLFLVEFFYSDEKKPHILYDETKTFFVSFTVSIELRPDRSNLLLGHTTLRDVSLYCYREVNTTSFVGYG